MDDNSSKKGKHFYNSEDTEIIFDARNGDLLIGEMYNAQVTVSNNVFDSGQPILHYSNIVSFGLQLGGNLRIKINEKTAANAD